MTGRAPEVDFGQMFAGLSDGEAANVARLLHEESLVAADGLTGTDVLLQRLGDASRHWLDYEQLARRQAACGLTDENIAIFLNEQ